MATPMDFPYTVVATDACGNVVSESEVFVLHADSDFIPQLVKPTLDEMDDDGDEYDELPPPWEYQY